MTTQTMDASKYDVMREYKYLFQPSTSTAEIVKIPPFKYLMIDGKGDPNTSDDFGKSMEALFGLAYTIKFKMKKDANNSFDFKVAPPSGLWHADDPEAFIQPGRKDEWTWTLMILQPDKVTVSIFEEAKADLKKKKNPQLLDNVYYNVYEEGLCAQIMHVGPYSQEESTIRLLHNFFMEQGYTFNGRHHEIYLSDQRRTKPERLKTIIRQPIVKINL